MGAFLEKCFGPRRRIPDRYATLPFQEEVEDYLKSRKERGHSWGSMYRILRVLEAFFLFLRHRRRCLERLTDISTDDVRIFQACRRNHGEFFRRLGHVERFLAHAFDKRGKTFSLDATGEGPFQKLLQEHRDFGRAHRGLSESSLTVQRVCLQGLQTFLIKKGIDNVRNVTLDHMDAFVTEKSATWSRRSLSSLISALRSFLRFLYLSGYIERDLAGLLVYPSRFSGDFRFKYLPWKKIQKFVASLPRRSARDKRDYAICMLLTSYGLRGREVTALRADGIDFKQRRLSFLKRKDAKWTVLPLFPAVAAALKDYLDVRRDSSHPEVFLSCRAPVRPLANVSGVIGRHMHQHFGHLLPKYGAYVLRHSFAKAMLDRGAPLGLIGLLLGHKSLTTTFAYSRIDIEGLRTVADNYANLLIRDPERKTDRRYGQSSQ